MLLTILPPWDAGHAGNSLPLRQLRHNLCPGDSVGRAFQQPGVPRATLCQTGDLAFAPTQVLVPSGRAARTEERDWHPVRHAIRKSSLAQRIRTSVPAATIKEAL